MRPTDTSRWSLAEFMAVVLSRQLKDEAVGILGTRSEVAEAACGLAQATHAPGLWYMSGPSGVVNPRRGELGPIADEGLIVGAEALLELTDNIDMIDWSRRTFGFAVLGGIQVDTFGNLNTVAVGEWSRPRLRGPGTIGASVLAAHSGDVFIVMNEHTVRSFVPAVDFVSAIGFGRSGRERDRMGLPGRGPQLVISPLGVLDFGESDHRMRVRTIHPWSSLEALRENTGFDLEEAPEMETTAEPSSAELDVLRGTVDRSGVLRQPGGGS